MSVGRSVCRSVGPSVCPSVCHTLLFLHFWGIRVEKFVFEHAPAQIIAAPAQIITAPTQLPATGVVVYTALFSLLDSKKVVNVSARKRLRKMKGSSLYDNVL